MLQKDIKVGQDYACWKYSSNYGSVYRGTVIAKGIHTTYSTRKNGVRIKSADSIYEREVPSRRIVSTWAEHERAEDIRKQQARDQLEVRWKQREKNQARLNNLPDSVSKLRDCFKALERIDPTATIPLSVVEEIAGLIQPGFLPVSADLCTKCETNNAVEGDYMCAGCRYG